MEIPLTSGDLRAIAEAIDEVEATTLAANKLLGRIELFRPDDSEQVGWVTRFDESDPDLGWGYVPTGGGSDD